MIYYYKSERYAQIVDYHNDLAYDTRNGLLSDSEYGSDDESVCSDSDSSLEGRRRWRPTRFSNYGGGKVPKRHRTRWRDTV